MAATLALVFRTRLRLLPLALALAAAGLTFGALSLAGGSLTMASIAVLPVLIGLAVDYAIQFHARFDEEVTRRAEGAGGAVDTRSAATAAAAAGGPTILTAGVATAVGFLVLLLSPVPMVRGFGALLVVGIALALACAACAGFAALVRFGAPPARAGPAGAAAAAARGWPRSARHPRVVGARERVADRAWRALGFALSQPRRVLAVGLAVAVVGPRARHPERGGLGRPRAGAAGPPGAEGRERAAGRDRSVGRDRRDRAGRRHHRRGSHRLDDALPGGRPARPRLPGRQALHAGEQRARAVPGALAARTCSAPPDRASSRSASCSTRCRPTSPRA